VARELRVPFSLRGRSGLIAVSVTPNSEPDSIGYALLTGAATADAARGYPICRATVTYPAQGYAAMFGWIQVVRSTDSGNGEFELDPIAFYRGLPVPFAFFGVRPELFDAPSRESRYDLEWEAHSFLCVSPDAVISRRVQAIVGFSWGFTVSRGEIEFALLRVLGSPDWDGHLGLLGGGYSDWTFDRGVGTGDHRS
jgi:hypothetical protein